MLKRVILIVLDACGVGELPDAKDYGDIGAATIPNIAEAMDGLTMPNCERLGLGNIVPIRGVTPSRTPTGCFGKMAAISSGKDSTSGHWEITGVILDRPFPLYPNGFPKKLVTEFEKRAGVRTIGNITASGTEIIGRLGERHMETKELILYTSADSVFQLAAHEDIIAIERLYNICQIAREFLSGEHAVGRVIARPFKSEAGAFVRTANRRDFSLAPPSDTILDKLHKSNIPVSGIGKINDLFAGRGLDYSIKAHDNNEIMEKVIDRMQHQSYGLIFANLVDFDMLWGHRNDTEAFGTGLEQFDKKLPEILEATNKDDLLVLSSDHGCDPTLKHSTDHTREYVPLMVYGEGTKTGINLGTRKTFADIASTLAEIFNIDYTFPGVSFFGELYN
jgi:phosphopentomutase